MHISKANGSGTYTVADGTADGIEIHGRRDSARGSRSDRGHKRMSLEARYNREREGDTFKKG